MDVKNTLTVIATIVMPMENVLNVQMVDWTVVVSVVVPMKDINVRMDRMSVMKRTVP
jgi:hypothetical protein